MKPLPLPLPLPQSSDGSVVGALMAAVAATVVVAVTAAVVAVGARSSGLSGTRQASSPSTNHSRLSRLPMKTILMLGRTPSGQGPTNFFSITSATAWKTRR